MAITVDTALIDSAVKLIEAAKSSKCWDGPDTEMYWQKAKQLVNQAIQQSE